LVATQLGNPAATVGEKAQRLGVTSELLPDWFPAQSPSGSVSPNLDVLHTRAPLWLRLQAASPDLVFEEFKGRGWTWHTSPVLPSAIELAGEVDVTGTESFKRGQIEIQDIGSQLLLPAVGPQPGKRWLDACAGAGGKTLQLARLLGANGAVVAHDIRPAALAELGERARRASLANITISTEPAGLYDGVLVDAPCTGTGTWRRSPHLKWCTTLADVQDAALRQKELLSRFCSHVAPGGLLVYATCSLCQEENQRVIESFLKDHVDFMPLSYAREFGAERGATGLTFWPAIHDSDGFFVAALQRR
jgi:16S rRNA (cytosine967-C5)-methyltransferase